MKLLFVSLALWIPCAVAADAAAGKALFDKSCKSCHGPDGKGNPAIAKAMKVELKALGSKEVQAKSDDQLAKESVEGIGKMRPVKGISDAQAKDLVAHLRTLKP